MSGAARNIALYPWFRFFQNLLFWQAIWFLFFQSELSAAEAILLFAIYDIATTLLELPSGYMSDRWGRRRTLIASALAGVVSGLLFTFGSGFWVFAAAQCAMGAHIAFASGTDGALLYESLVDEGRGGEIEAQELRAFRATFAGLGLSALLGGAMAIWGLRFPFAANALAFLALTFLALAFAEPGREARAAETDETDRLRTLRAALLHPALMWLFGLSVLFYGFSHLPFVFGQPFILEALGGAGFTTEAAFLSGLVTAVMMVLTLGASLIAPRLRDRLGLTGLLLLAFAMLVALAGGLALFGSLLAVPLLLLRKVPDSFAQPFIAATIQPLLSNAVRASYVSIRSLTARLLFAASLSLASVQASQVGLMTLAEVQTVLGAYAVAGLIALALLAATAGALRRGA